MTEWDRAAIDGQLGSYQGEQPPRLPRSIVFYWSTKLGNNEEARVGNFSGIVAGTVAVLLLLVVGAMI